MSSDAAGLSRGRTGRAKVLRGDHSSSSRRRPLTSSWL